MTTKRDAKDGAEDYLWIGPGILGATPIDRHRLASLRAGAKPKCPAEELLVANPEWLRFYLGRVIGQYTVMIRDDEPLPEWDEGFVLAMEGTRWAVR